MAEIKKERWEDSYQRAENFLFHPNEEIIRFVSQNIRKRTGLDRFTDLVAMQPPPKVLDLGCGIGRHIFFLREMGLDAHGIDLSESAISTLKVWAQHQQISDIESKVTSGDARELPWKDDTFDYAVSHGVLDSMPFEVARVVATEVHRVLKGGGLFYLDLISGDDSSFDEIFDGEIELQRELEQGTIQSYFDEKKIDRLIGQNFSIQSLKLIKSVNALTGQHASRYHCVIKSIE